MLIKREKNEKRKYIGPQKPRGEAQTKKIWRKKKMRKSFLPETWKKKKKKTQGTH